MENYPSESEIISFLKNNPRSSIYNICCYFNQEGTNICVIKNKNSHGKYLMLAHKIKCLDFFKHIQKILNKNYIFSEIDKYACLMSDSYNNFNKNKYEFIFYVFSIYDEVQ